MKKIFFITTVALMMAGCKNNENTSVAVPAIDTTNFDKSVALNEDFYQFSTGGWQQKNPLRDEFARYGVMDALRENNEVRLNDLFKEMVQKETLAGTIDRKISDLYKMGLDSVRLNREAAAPIKGDLENIRSITNKDELSSAVARMHRTNNSALFGMGVQADLKNSNVNILYTGQDGLGMGNRDYYLDKENEKIKEGYIVYLNKILALAGYTSEEAKKIAEDDMEVETALAKKYWSNVELRDIQRMYNPISKADFMKKYNSLNWEKYFSEIGMADFDTLIVGQPSAMEAVNEIVASMPLDKVKNYLIAQSVDGAADYLSDDFSTAAFDFYGKVMSGKKEQKPRWKRAMNVPNGILSEAVGEMYVAKYFKKEDKERMLGIVANLQKSLGEHIAALDWMEDTTKAKAREKLAAFTVKIGYPDKWKDYSTLTVDPQLSYWENVKQAGEWYLADNLKEMGQSVDKEKWLISPQTVNAYYNPMSNEICFPAAILQPPFYNTDADDAVNYGAIGVVIGHEMTHGFDDMGRLFDKNGNMNNWWSENDAKVFKEKTAVLVKQFDSVEVLPGLNANGAFCLGENIADQGGLRIAYTAMKNSLNGVDPEVKDGYTAAQRFYLAYAQMWAQNIRNEEVARLTKMDEHSLAKNRVNVTLKNIDTFYEAFGITDGTMFLPEAERVIIW